MRGLLLSLALVGASILVAGCTGGNGTLTVQGTDPDDAIGDFSKLVVQLRSFTIHRSDGNENDVTSRVSSVDVTQLQGGNVTTLAQQEVPAGNYTWIRMGVTNATGTLKTGGNVTVDVPSDTLKLNGPFEVKSGATTTLRIDLNVVKTGNDGYKLTPVIGSIR